MHGAAWLLAGLVGLDWNMGPAAPTAEWVMVSRPASAATAELDWSMLSPALPAPSGQLPPQGHRYPIRGGHWSIGPLWNASRETVLQHLQSGQHAGKWDPSWLATLSHAELLSLHDDDHENRVQWAHVRRASAAPKPAVQTAYYRQPTAQPVKPARGVVRLFARPSGQTCPGGRCPR